MRNKLRKAFKGYFVPVYPQKGQLKVITDPYFLPKVDPCIETRCVLNRTHKYKINVSQLREEYGDKKTIDTVDIES